MKIKDIVNRDIVNLTNCDQEPIHIPGSIQPHGFLIALNDNLEIEFCSGNTDIFLGIGYASLLRKHISILLINTEVDELKNAVAKVSDRPSSPLVLDFNSKKFNCIFHFSGKFIVLDCEPIADSVPDVTAVYEQTVQFVKFMQEAATLKQLCQKVAVEIRNLTGYDRVMVYRFDKDYNGEVYAETKRDDLESFLGLHYPHTDIPVQARQLYIKNLLRIIVDVNYTPVPLYTIDDATEKNLDLSFSVLRSTSPIHVQYLQNMGVGATMTISLLHEGKLWGLIACHHYSELYIDHYKRINALLQGHFLTSQINIRQTAEEYTVAREANAALEKMLMNSFQPERSSLSEIIVQPSLLQLCNAAGVAIILDSAIYKAGNTPCDDDIRKIASWATPFSMDRFFSSSKLLNEYPDAESVCSTAAGLLFYNLSRQQHACIMWFNPETLEEVNWAGDPEKAIEKNENGLSPRKSFESWKIISKCVARPWAESELNAATNYAHSLQKHISMILLNEEERRQGLLAQQLKESNAELENINWISTHDLKEPLRKIQLFASKILMNKDDLTDETTSSLDKISFSAGRMQKLIEDLSLYAKSRQSSDNFEIIDLQIKVDRIISEMHDEIKNKNAIVKAHGLPKIRGIRVLIQQLFVNIISNSLKFSRKDVQPLIDITAHNEPVKRTDSLENYFQITVKDNGIGFEPEMNESVFKIFARLNPIDKYEGSGIGLAMSKKIMQLHDGHIDARGEKGVGTEIILYFPVQ